MHSSSTVSRSVEQRAHAIAARGAHRRLRSFVGASAQENLTYWRDQYRQIMETLETGLPFNSIARPALEEDLGVAAEMVALYEAQATEEHRTLV